MCCFSSYAQVYPQFERFSIRLSQDTSFFSPTKIKVAKIISLCILDSMFNVEGSETKDTIFIYEFDSTGIAIREVGFTYNKRSYDHDFRNYSKWWTNTKQFYHIETSDSDSIVTYLKIDTVGQTLDTSIKSLSRFDNNGRQIEFKYTTSERYKRMLDCSVKTFRHWKKDYDESGREISFSDFPNNIIQTTSYLDFGNIVKKRNMNSGELLQKDVTRIYRDDIILSECDGYQLSIIYFNKYNLPRDAMIIPDFWDPVTHMLEFEYSFKK